MVIPLSPPSVYTQYGAQRLCKLIFLRNQTMEVGPSSRTMEKCHLPWSDFMIHGVNMPLVTLPLRESKCHIYIHTYYISCGRSTVLGFIIVCVLSLQLGYRNPLLGYHKKKKSRKQTINGRSFSMKPKNFLPYFKWRSIPSSLCSAVDGSLYFIFTCVGM